MMCGPVDYIFIAAMSLALLALACLIPPLAVCAWGVTKFLLDIGKIK